MPFKLPKVAAHSSVQHASSPFEEWCFRNNCLADTTAVHANQMRPPEFWQLLKRHVQACIRVDGWNAEIREVLLQVGRMVVRHEAGDTEEQCAPEPKTDAIDFGWDGLPHEPCLPPGAVRWYGTSVVSKMMRWFWDVLQYSTASMVWISYSQLYIDFAISTGEPGPLKCPGWCDGADIPHQSLLSFGFKQRTKWFGKVLRETLRHGRIPVRSGYHRPKSFMIAMHAGCLALPWPEHRLEFIDRWIGRFVVDPFRRQSKAMDSLPVPCGDLPPRP